jgi:hypothetical protein
MTTPRVKKHARGLPWTPEQVLLRNLQGVFWDVPERRKQHKAAARLEAVTQPVASKIEPALKVREAAASSTEPVLKPLERSVVLAGPPPRASSRPFGASRERPCPTSSDSENLARLLVGHWVGASRAGRAGARF